MTRKINKKKVIGMLILLAIIVVMIFLIGRTFSRYESKSTAKKTMDIAFWVVDDTFKTETVIVEDIYPSDDEYVYNFSVLNNDGTKVAETAMKYDIVITTTTNMPLEYRVEKNNEECTVNQSLYLDEDGTYFRKLKLDSAANELTFDKERTESYTKKLEDEFTLFIKFPKEYSNQELYADLIENINIELTANQIIGE